MLKSCKDIGIEGLSGNLETGNLESELLESGIWNSGALPLRET
jgi:hypothetical protein